MGKSSLIRAGVIPALKRSGEGWETVIIRPGRAPLGALVDILDALDGRTSTSSGLPSTGDRAALIARLTAEPGHLGGQLRAWAERKLRRLLIFVDQFEEVYTAQPAAAERTAFLACLASIGDDASSPLRVVMSMRSDFLERMSEDRAFMAAATRGLVFLASLARAGLAQALEEPVAAAGYRFESPAMVEEGVARVSREPEDPPLRLPQAF